MSASIVKERQNDSPPITVEGPLANVLLCHIVEHYDIGIEEDNKDVEEE